MIIHLPLLTKVLSIYILLLTNAFAEDFTCNKSMKVLKRKGLKGHQMVFQNLKNLICTNGKATKFEGQNFKIVGGKSNIAITFNDEPELVTKAANVYYHLEFARSFWINEIKSDFITNLEQITIRLDIKNLFSKNAHFKNINKGENYNNAWTVPSGKTPDMIPEEKKDEWGLEIWFAPPKIISTSELVQSRGDNPLSDGLRELQEPILNETYYDIERSMVGNIIEGDSLIDTNSLQDLLLRSLVLHTFYRGLLFFTDKIDLWFLEKNFYIDTAMIPDIIYHEYSHVALSKKLPLSNGTPVIEGLADYFATRISKSSAKMFNSIYGYSSNNSKDPNNQILFDPLYEERSLSEKDFVLSLLWTVRKNLEQGNEKRLREGYTYPLVNTDHLIYRSTDYLDGNSNINNGLSKALIKSCRILCKNKMSGVSIIQSSLEEKGL